MDMTLRLEVELVSKRTGTWFWSGIWRGLIRGFSGKQGTVIDVTSIGYSAPLREYFLRITLRILNQPINVL
jgi:hypothetical protein